VVTVLFADLVGFTSLAEHLDPEQVKRLIDASFQILVDDITTFGGTVDKLIGDGIVALFGVPVAHEDDAERAVRAALRMQDSLAAFANSRIATAVAPTLQMRVGINTGVALVGTVAGTDYTAMGDVVNLASRLQTLAPPGGILVGESTHGLTRASIEYEAIGDLSAKGREAMVPAWLAKAAVAQPGARHRRRDIGIMGRSTELALALASVNFSIMNSQAALLAVDGEGGVGKSRLVDELLDNVASSYSALVLKGSAVPYGQSNRWWPLASALFDRLEMDAATPADVVREVGLAQGRELFGDDDEASLNEMAEAFQHLLGYPSRLDELDPQAGRDAVFRVVARVLERRLEQGPVLLSITDVHWADPVVLSLFEHLLVTLARTPFVLVTTNRPDPELLWPPITTRAAVVRLPLEPLGPISAAQMVRAIIGNDVDEATIATIYERSGGNPLFLEELAVLVGNGGDVTALPDSLRAVIAARLDQLPTDQRSTIDNAAVLGPSGAVQSLERFAAALGGVLDSTILDGLVDSGLLSVTGRRWSFKSDSVREVAYNTLTKAVRAVRHYGVAHTMQDHDGNLDDIAHHLAAAAEIVAELGPIDLVPATIRDQALVALEAKAQRASDQGNLRQIARSCLRAIDLFPETTTGDLHRRISLLRLRRIGALVELRHLDTARAESRLVLADALSTGDQVIEAGSRRVQGLISQAAGDLPTARVQLGDAIDLFREIGDRPQLAETLRLRGFLELFGGSLPEAEWLFGEAAGLYADLGDRRGLGYIEQHRAWMSFLGGHMAEAETHLSSAADTLTELGDRAGVGWAFGLLAYVKFFGRHFDEAETLANLVRTEAKERGDEWAEAMMMSLLASMRLWTGNLDAASSLAEHSRAKFKRLGDGFGLAQALGVLGRTQVALGDPNVSRTTETLLSRSEPFGESPYPLLAVAGIAMHGGDGKSAVLYADEAIVRMLHIAADASEPYIIRAVGQAQIGDFDGARQSLDHLEGDMSGHPFAQSANALVAILEGRPDVAIASAQLVADAPGHTYLDGVVARISAGAACAMLADPAGARRWLAESVAQATSTQDSVATALALLAYHHVLGVVHDSGPGDLSALGAGWRSVIDAMPHLELVADPS